MRHLPTTTPSRELFRMGTKSAASAALARVRGTTRAARSLSPAAVIALSLAFVFGGVGIAGAATGAALILGRSNTETSSAGLSDSRGTPLSLSAPKNKAPLAVNRSAMVPNLNAQYVGGLGEASLKLTGGSGYSPPNSDIALAHNSGRVVAKTGKLPAGTYFVTATALIDVSPGDFQGECGLYDPGYAGGEGGSEGPGDVQAAEDLTVRLTVSGVIEEECYVSGTGDGSEAIDGGITAIREG